MSSYIYIYEILEIYYIGFHKAIEDPIDILGISARYANFYSL